MGEGKYTGKSPVGVGGRYGLGIKKEIISSVLQTTALGIRAIKTILGRFGLNWRAETTRHKGV
jgi:hypothetical protein